MATPTYTQADMRNSLNQRVHGKLSNLIDVEETLNSAVRQVVGDQEIDLRSTKRRTTLAPNLFDDIYSCTLPSDVKANRLIDIIPQVKYERKPDWDLVPEDYFERMKERRENLVSLADDDLDRRLLVSRLVKDQSVVIGQMESPTGDGDTWSGFAFIANGDTDNQAVTDSDIKEDDDDFVTGNGAIRFSDNADTTATQAGIENRGLDAMDLSEYISRGSVFIRGRLTTGDTNITALTVRLGSDSSNYYQVSDSTTNENTPFVTGWNLVRMDFSGKTTTGTPIDTAIDYAAIFWTKTANTHLTDTDYGFDQLVVKKGQIYDLLYYSRFLWQNSSGTYQENSSATTDRINVSNDEYELIMDKAWELASIELRDYTDMQVAQASYMARKNAYSTNNPSEAMVLLQPMYEFSTAPVNYKGDIDNTMNT